MAKTPYLDTDVRFMSYVVKKESGCWEWTGTKVHFGYGVIKIKGELHRTHRWAYEHFVGEIPAGLHVLHTCDNPPCVNPDHLMVGTPKENMRQCIERGRHRFGRRAKLNHDKAERIRGLSKTATPKDMAMMFGVSVNSIYDVLNGRTWGHV